jgi:AcrR family transcriptional regulator
VETTIAMIREDGYDQTTMEGIAKACEITKRTLYKYYPVKEAILADYVKVTFAARHDSRSESLEKMTTTEQRAMYYMRALMAGVMREPVIFEHYIVYVMRMLVSHHETSSGEGSGVGSLIASIIAGGREEGVINADLSDEMIADLFLFAFVEMTKNYYRAPGQFDLKATSTLCVTMFMRAISPAKSKGGI